MQTQDAPAEILFNLWPWLEANQKRIIAVLVTIVVVAGIFYFISAQHAQHERDAGEAMTQLLLSPSANVGQSADALVQLAGKYTGTEAAKRALLQGATSLFAAGRYADAQAQYQNYLQGGASGPLAATAQLGLGASLEAQGKLTEAATAYQRVVANNTPSVGLLEAYCGLGRIAEAQGNLNEAANEFQAAMQTGRDGGSVAQSAYFSFQAIKAKMASAPKPAVKPVTTVAAPAASVTSTSAPTFVFPSK